MQTKSPTAKKKKKKKEKNPPPAHQRKRGRDSLQKLSQNAPNNRTTKNSAREASKVTFIFFGVWGKVFHLTMIKKKKQKDKERKEKKILQGTKREGPTT
jgi:hypothetical protein